MVAGLGGPVDVALEKALDGSALRHRAIAENLANVDTPGYKRLEVDFAAALKGALEGAEPGPRLARTDPRHLDGLAEGRQSGVTTYRVTSTSGRADGNNVDLDAEMTKLAENTLWYDSLTQVLGRRLAMLRFVLNEGRR